MKPVPPLRFFVIVLAAVFATAGHAEAAPQITKLGSYGLRIGTTTTLIVEGSDLLPGARLVSAAPIATQLLRPGGSATRVAIEVTIPGDASPSHYALRVANSRGISNAVMVAVDDLPQLPFASKIEQLPVALNGTLSGNETLKTSFIGTKGQRIAVDLEARRLGASFDPVITLYDSRHVQLAWSQGHVNLGGDARLQHVLPADGTYTVELNDILYRGGMPNHFRLKIGDLRYADLAFPLGIRRGTTGTFQLIGEGVTGPLQAVADSRDAIGDMQVRLPSQEGVTGTAPRVVLGDVPEVMQATMPAGKLQEIVVPAAINGRLAKPGQEDRYRIRVKPGDRLRFDVQAHRLGSALDGVLTISDEAGKVLATADDRVDDVDPLLDFSVPSGVQNLVVSLKDLQRGGGAMFVYRVLIAPANSPDFSLTLFEDRRLIPAAGTSVVRVRANRLGYSGPIKLHLVDLPRTMQVAGDNIPSGPSQTTIIAGDIIHSGATDTLLTLTVRAGVEPAQWLTQIIGENQEGNTKILRPALRTESPTTRNQPWLRSELAMAVTPQAPIQVAWEQFEPSLGLGTSSLVRVKVQRSAGVKGAVRLSLLTSQIVPKVQGGMQDDINRALRMEGTPTIGAGQSAGAATILVPADLLSLPYDLVVQADLLAADGNTIVATAYTPGRRVSATQPISLTLTSPASVQAKSGAGQTGKLSGKVTRLGNYNKPVKVALAGLPPELPAPSITVPADRGDFELPVAFPYETKLGSLSNVRVVATGDPIGNRPIRSNEVAVAVNVVAGDPPPPAPALFRVFEDEASLPALLFEGAAKVELESLDRFSGTTSLRVGNGVRSRSKMPAWSFKIVEKPGPGEFRYLRYAWKKPGNGNIAVRLFARDGWAPKPDATARHFRYEAGPDASMSYSVFKLSNTPPGEWATITRDLFADFGIFTLTGIGFSAGAGEPGLFDHVYLARSPEDFKGCPTPITPEKPLLVFEDQAGFVDNLNEGSGTASLDTSDKFTGTSSVKVTPDQRFNERLPGLNVRIRENPGQGEFRFVQFAWKKKGGETICLQLNHDGQWGPSAGNANKFRYHAGPGPECYGASLAIDRKVPEGWTLITRDLFADFGEFTLTGLALSPVDGEFALFDHIYLGKTARDFELAKPGKN